MTCGVYLIENTETGRGYVGSARNIQARWREHRRELRNNVHINSKLQRAWNKYGEEAFTLRVVARCNPEHLLTREQHWIELRDSVRKGYNIALQASSPMAGRKHTSETIQRITKGTRLALADPKRRAAMLAGAIKRFSDPTARKDVSDQFRYCWNNPEYRKRVSKAIKNGWANPETRAKKSAASKEWWAVPENATKMSEMRCGERNSFYGKIHSAETKRRISDAVKAACERKRRRACS